ncbi:MAG: histidinol-phosphatase [Hyphomicrobiales bacterium]|jgi:histidinol-phosphatase|nr:histidinol-phosphatase [Hyphomicrobiales bacterium]
MQEHQHRLNFAVRAARSAGDLLARYFREDELSSQLKPDGSTVTAADIEAEQLLRGLLTREFPDYGIWGEELGRVGPEKASFWCIDPLDGTRWFGLGVPIFGTLIAFVERGEPTLGVIHFPIADETIYAARGFGCWYRRQSGTPYQLHVKSIATLGNSVVSASGIHGTMLRPGKRGEAYNLTDVARSAREFYFGGDCLQYALLCRGKIQVAIDTIMQPWDIAALIPCVEEAGGVVAGLDGHRDDILRAGGLIAASNSSLLNEVVASLSECAVDPSPNTNAAGETERLDRWVGRDGRAQSVRLALQRHG